jgi:polyhydroxyalkanoate synthesis repressor PhaR
MAMPLKTPPEAKPGDQSPVVVKKYANRRLYNTESSSYVTLESLAYMVHRGRDFVVHDAKSGDDITRSVLTQIIVEEDAKGQNLLPINPEDRELIDRAAQLTGKTKTAFVLEAVRRAAEDALLERTLFLAGPAAFEAFRARLDEAPNSNDRLRRTLQTPAPWE